MLKKDSENNTRQWFKILVPVFSAVLAMAALEIFLKIFFPLSVLPVGHLRSENSRLYGWGFHPNEMIRIKDPDAAEVFTARINNHGWRDKDRTFENSLNAFRILVLGDSNTFGAIVPDDKVYTRILEDKLRVAGFNAEVINMACSGWATDQQLDALKTEGVRYAPDYIIFQFCTNDLDEILAWRHDPDPVNRAAKPFYYTLDESGNLVRRPNPSHASYPMGWKQRIKSVALKFEILKRVYVYYSSRKMLEHRPVSSVGYLTTAKRIEHLKQVMDVNPEAPFILFLQSRIGTNIDEAELKENIDRFGLSSQKNLILRLLESRAFQDVWDHTFYDAGRYGPNAPGWPLYFSMTLEARSVAQGSGAVLALFSDNDVGQYEWERSWHRVSDQPGVKQRYLEPTRMIRQFSATHGIDFIENVRPHIRGRNDPHPNIAGNQAMAENIFQHLMKYHEKLLYPYRTIKRKDCAEPGDA